MAQNIVDGDLFVRGLLKANRLVMPANSVGDSQFNLADPLAASKQQHQYVVTCSQARGSASATERRVIHVAFAAGSLLSVVGGVSVVCVGDSTITVDILKNGTSILSSPVEIDSTHAAFETVLGAVGTQAYAVDDVFEVSVTATVGTGTLCQGVFCSAVFRESAE